MTSMLWHRRAVLAAMTALAAAPVARLDAASCGGDNPFALGVASGDPNHDGFVLWTRLVGANAQPLQAAGVSVEYEIAADEAFRHVVRRGYGVAVPERAHSLHVEIAGLASGRSYWYRFHAMGVTSPVGRAVTVPHAADRLRIAVTSCQHWEQARFGTYRDIVAREPDLILQLGDYIYEQSYTASAKIRLFGASEPQDLAGYRQRHALYKTDPELQIAHRSCPWIVTWDDHEVLNDYAGLANREGLTPTLFGRRRAAAYQAYFEHMPIRPSLWRSRPSPRLFRAVDWADLVSLSVLDTRQYRSSPPCALPNVARNVRIDNCAEANRPDRTILGAEQERWLSRRLAGERRIWTLIGQQVFFAPMYLDEAQTATFSDQWDGYAANRTRVLQELMRPNIRNPIVLSGDVHSFWVNDLNDVAGKRIGAEIVTSALGAASPPPGRFGDVHANNPHVRFSEVEHAGYIMLDIDRETLTADLRMIDDRRLVDSPVRSAATFRMEAGAPGAWQT